MIKTKTGATVHEVASRAGVSIATVSRVSRGIGQVAPATRYRVLAVIEELGYRPNHLGRALAERRHAALGIVFPGLTGPYYFQVLEGFEGEAIAAKQSLLILGTHLLRQADELVLEMAARVDGIAIFGGAIATAAVRQLVDSGLPTILLADHPVNGAAAVRVDNVQATVNLTLHLIRDHGFERIVFVGNPAGSPDITERWHAFIEAHRLAGLMPPDEPIRVGLQQSDGLIAAAQMLQADRHPRAAVCANDETALGLCAGAVSRGVRIPHDLAVTGWDDIPLAGLVSPPLTTVRQPMRELGAYAARALLARIRNVHDELSNVVLPTELVIRASCGCAPGALQPADQPPP